MSGPCQDLRYAVRTLRSVPGFTCASVLVFALGIGATTAIFSLVDGALLRPLPFHDAGRLVKIFERSPLSQRNSVALLNFQDWRDQNHSFAAMAGAGGGGLTSLTDGLIDLPEPVTVQNVTPGFFEVFGIAPIAGRTFAPGESNDKPFIVLSERVWRTRFNSNPAIIDGTVRLGGIPNIVIGIMPAGFEILSKVDVWTLLPIGLTMQARRVHFLEVVGRLRPGVTLEQATADLGVVAENIARISPETNKGWSVTLDPLQRAIVSDELRRTSLVLAAGVLFILLMACANVANLLLARGVTRTHEIAVRAALGASRRRIAVQLIAESVLLASMGTVVGVGISWAVLRAAPAFVPARTIPAGIVLAVDWRLIAFAVTLAFATALGSGVAPVWQATRVSLVEAIGTGNRTSIGRGGRIRAILAAVQIAAALLLVIGAGLFVRTLIALNTVDAGFRGDNVLTANVSLPFFRYRTPDQWLRFYESIRNDITRLPGVRGASFVCCDVPLDGYSMGQPFEVMGPPIDPASQPIAHFQLVGPDYFETMGMTILRGRAFTERDIATTSQVCIVNEEFVRRYLRGRDPVGARIGVRSLVMRESTIVPREVVGVLRQVKLRPGEIESAVEIYIPFAQNPWFSGKFVVNTAGNPQALIPSIKSNVARVDKGLVVTRVRTMADVGAEATAPPRFRAALVGAFAALALILAGVGVFGVLSYSVRQRAREFSVRMALGARRSHVVGLVLAQGLTLAAAGLAGGFAVAFALLRFIASLLFGVQPIDPIAFGGAAAALGIFTLVACAVPAMLATRSDPAVMLRQE
jgi:putative ABC transport system permease protein